MTTMQDEPTISCRDHLNIVRDTRDRVHERYRLRQVIGRAKDGTDYALTIIDTDGQTIIVALPSSA